MCMYLVKYGLLPLHAVRKQCKHWWQTCINNLFLFLWHFINGNGFVNYIHTQHCQTNECCPWRHWYSDVQIYTHHNIWQILKNHNEHNVSEQEMHLLMCCRQHQKPKRATRDVKGRIIIVMNESIYIWSKRFQMSYWCEIINNTRLIFLSGICKPLRLTRTTCFDFYALRYYCFGAGALTRPPPADAGGAE